jgi:hypothetical protein
MPGGGCSGTATVCPSAYKHAAARLAHIVMTARPSTTLSARLPYVQIERCGCEDSMLSLGGGSGGRGVADGQADGPVAEVGDEVQTAAERFDVAGDDVE